MVLLLLLQLSLLPQLSSNTDLWLNREVSNEQMLDLINSEEKTIIQSDKNYNYKISLIELSKGKVYLSINNKKLALMHLENATNYAKKANLNNETSENYRVISESGTYIMLLKGVYYIIKNSKEINDYALKAIEMDSNNLRAKIIVAAGLINAPKIFGGDIYKGISILESLSTEKSEKEVQFNRVIVLVNGYITLKDEPKAKEYLIQALKIYPNNKEANELLLTF